MTIIVPYRSRPEHLAQFIPYMRECLPDARILIVEQAEGKPFNRGRLINIGFLETKPEYIIAHDIDMLPLGRYRPGTGVIQLAKSSIQPVGYLGGVTMFDSDTFRLVGGYHNDYFHRAEDNELAFNLKRLRIPVLNRFSCYKTLWHSRSGPEFIPELWERAQKPREVQNQLAACDYEVVERQVADTHTHIIVEV